MIRQNVTHIVKRSIHCRRCMFQQPQKYHGSNLVFREQPRSFRSSALMQLRVSSTTTTTTGANTSNGLLAHATNATSLLKRAMPLVSKEAMRDALPIIGNGAYMALASGFLMTDMLQLRCLLVGGYAGLVTFHSLHAKPLQIPLRWSALFVVVNAGAVVLLLLDQWIGALLSEDEKALYERHFKDGLTPGQFYHLLEMATTQEIDNGSLLTKEGCMSPNLYFIEKGQAKVYHRGTFASYVDEGGFVNDVAFQQLGDKSHGTSSIKRIGSIETNAEEQSSGFGAYGTVVANGDCKVLVWDQTELKDYLEKHPDTERNMKYTLSRHLVRSLLKQREVRRRASTGQRDALVKTELTMPERTEFPRIKTSTWP